jgi:hypothetical protein
MSITLTVDHGSDQTITNTVAISSETSDAGASPRKEGWPLVTKYTQQSPAVAVS